MRFAMKSEALVLLVLTHASALLPNKALPQTLV
jgi:hypothetical protein